MRPIERLTDWWSELVLLTAWGNELEQSFSFSHLTNLVCERHIKASSDFTERILTDSEHPQHEESSKARSHASTRSRFKLLPSKTAAYRNSVLPALSRLLVDRNAELNYYIRELSWSISSSSPFPLSLLYNFSNSLVSTTWSLSKKRLRILLSQVK